MTSLLRSLPIFASLPGDEVDELAALSRLVELGEDEIVFREGDPADELYVVEIGSIALYRDAVGHAVQLLFRAGPGDYFGEMGLFGEAVRSASARAIEPTRILAIPQTKLDEALVRHPTLALKLQISAARRRQQNVAAALDLGRREEVRVRIDTAAEIELEDGTRQGLHLENLSIGGMSVRGGPDSWSQGIEVGCLLHFAGERLAVNGRVAWQRGDAIGIAFSERQSDHDRTVYSMLRQLVDPRR